MAVDEGEEGGSAESRGAAAGLAFGKPCLGASSSLLRSDLCHSVDACVIYSITKMEYFAVHVVDAMECFSSVLK